MLRNLIGIGLSKGLGVVSRDSSSGREPLFINRAITQHLMRRITSPINMMILERGVITQALRIILSDYSGSFSFLRCSVTNP